MQFVPLVGDQTAAFTGGRTGLPTDGQHPLFLAQASACV